MSLTLQKAEQKEYNDIINYMTNNNKDFFSGICLYCKVTINNNDISSIDLLDDTITCPNCLVTAVISDNIFKNMSINEKQYIIDKWSKIRFE